MDKFDDLPDIVEKDTKPKFLTEVHQPAPADQQVSNGLMPLFDEEPTDVPHEQVQAEVDAVVADHQFVDEVDKGQ